MADPEFDSAGNPVPSVEDWFGPAIVQPKSRRAYSMAPKEQMRALIDAVWQVLDDMGTDGTSCCGMAKAQLRIAFEPFRGDDEPVDYSLEDAQRLMNEVR